jgi:hypothetical protein
MAAAIEPINTSPTYADIDRGGHRIMELPGLLFWAWIGFCATVLRKNYRRDPKRAELGPI